MANRNSTLRVALYARVSTLDQSTDSQLLDLRRYVRERGWHLYREDTDNGISGTVGFLTQHSLLVLQDSRNFVILSHW